MIFDCKFWGVVRVDIAHNSDGTIVERDTIANLEGIWDTKYVAEKWMAAQHPRTEKPSWWSEGDGYETEEYVLVPCANLHITWIGELDSKMNEFAKLYVLGVGASR